MSKKQEHRRQKKAAKRRASSKARRNGCGSLYKFHQRQQGNGKAHGNHAVDNQALMRELSIRILGHG